MIDDMKYWMRHNWELMVVLGIIFLLIGFLVLLAVVEDRQMNAAYPVWVKQTGNPKGLTLEEWRLYMNAIVPKQDITIINAGRY